MRLKLTAAAMSLLFLAGCSENNNGPLWLSCGVPAPEGVPASEYRILNHWDNLDDTVERGYAGHSIWEWTSDEIPVKRIEEYGRLNQSIGINGVVLNNVNANPTILDSLHLDRVRAIADILRPYGMRVYLSVNFASPLALGELPTADPLDGDVVKWWKAKASYIYSLIPDFGGFLVKASSEGQPGPQDFGRTHVDGANMLADAVAPFGGIVMWRAFVYAPDSPDRACQAYEEFQPLDGQFKDNVIIQIKNGPVDFQPREPVSSLFWAMKKTAVMPEFQITQEYTGQDKQMCYLAPMWKECLDTLYNNGLASTAFPAFAGVANVGRSPLWCGQVFAQANWYAFGRLAWDPSLSSEQIAREWICGTFRKPWWCSERRFRKEFVEPVTDMMLASREMVVDYMMPLGLHHIFAGNHHYGPEPWYAPEWCRPDWTPPYYHKASADGIGFDRTMKGSGNVAQYPEALCRQYDSVESCPENLLLWFHHLPWNHVMKSGRTLWDELCLHYDRGCRQALDNVALWKSLKPYVEKKMWESVMQTLVSQEKDARWWRDACLQYFGEFSGMDIPQDVASPEIPLDSLKRIQLKQTIHS